MPRRYFQMPREGRGNGTPRRSWAVGDRGGSSGRPAGLRGKEIGLYYRDQQRQNKPKKEITLNLCIPPSVVRRGYQLLNNIDANVTPDPLCNPNKRDWFDDTAIGDNTTEFSMNAGSSSSQLNNSQDMIREDRASFKDEKIVKANPSTKDGLLSSEDVKKPNMNSMSAYKYSYTDIITGTFMEKLEECLSKNEGIFIKDEDTAVISYRFYEDYQSMIRLSRYKQMMAFREKLPTYKKREAILELINNNQVVVISGETGCGKSTQVPQLILDEAIIAKRGANCKVVVTQPRRIAASSLAARVADERAENMGNSVGYVVRLEKVEPRRRGSITYCTTGVLLAELELDQAMSGVSHVILDEVHERDCHVDLAMCMLKQVISKRKDLKLILMSATLDADRLSAYFNGCPSLHIEGLAYPVQDIFLEDILKLTGFKLEPKKDKEYGFQSGNRNEKRYRGKGGGKSRRMAVHEEQKDIQYRAEIGPWLESKKGELDPAAYETLKDRRIEEMNLDLVFAVVKYICQGEPGAILVFLPGIAQITTLLGLMENSGFFSSGRYEIYPLHSKLPSLEQKRIFERPRDGVRKIIVATNIAETSITIDDVVYVVDCARIKVLGLNIEENVSTLGIKWVSKANLRQRRGRAGRVQPGVCYHLLTSHKAEQLEDRLLPELQRSDLLEPVLQVKKLRLGKAADALTMVAEPPDPRTVAAAVNHLKRCGALDEKETLTPLGWHLARLPLHPAAGKLLLLGALFGCLDRAASVAATWGFKDPFMMVIGKEREVEAMKQELAQGEPSDHVAISEAILQWERCSRKHQFAYKYFLSNSTLQLLTEMKKQLADNLRDMGFLSSANLRSRWENRNEGNLSIFKAVVAAALYPNIGIVRWHGKNGRNPRVILRTPEDGRVQAHPSSVVANVRGLSYDKTGANWLVYWLKRRSTNLFLFDVTLVHTMPLLFFGELQITKDTTEGAETTEGVETTGGAESTKGAESTAGAGDYKIRISDVVVKCARDTTALLVQLRARLDRVLANRIGAEHDIGRNRFEETVLDAVIELITAEDEQMEYEGLDDGDLRACAALSGCTARAPARRLCFM